MRLPVNVADWTCSALQLLFWTAPPPSPFGPSHTGQTRLKPLAQWCSYSSAFSKMHFFPSPHLQIKLFFFLFWIKGKMDLRLPKPNLHGAITLPRSRTQLGNWIVPKVLSPKTKNKCWSLTKLWRTDQHKHHQSFNFGAWIHSISITQHPFTFGI